MGSTSWKSLFAGVVITSGATVFLGCFGGHMVKVIPDPDTATVSLDGNQVGTGVTELELEKEEGKDYALKVCEPEGYYCSESIVNQHSPSTLQISLQKDHSFFDTVDGVDNVNKWLQIPVDPQYPSEEAWQKITSSITSAISDFEVLDQKSFYLKSAWKMAGKKGDTTRLRSRFVVSVQDPDPANLVFKVKIESERVDGNKEKVDDTGRTFRDFLEALDTVKARVGKK